MLKNHEPPRKYQIHSELMWRGRDKLYKSYINPVSWFGIRKNCYNSSKP